MSLNLLIGVGVISLGTFLSTSQTGLNYKDEILKLRQEKKEGMELQQLAQEKEPQKKVFGKGKMYYTNKRQNTREGYVRSILESIFRTPFKSVRPEWLLNPHTGRRLEIDCFCQSLRLCVEVDGRQHSQFLPHFHKTYQKFQDMRERDIMKAVMIRKRGLKLIRVPHTIGDDQLESYLLEQINKVM